MSTTHITYVETLEKLREFALKRPDARTVAIYTFGWACGVCVAVGVSLDECAGFLKRYKNEQYEKDSAS